MEDDEGTQSVHLPSSFTIDDMDEVKRRSLEHSLSPTDTSSINKLSSSRNTRNTRNGIALSDSDEAGEEEDDDDDDEEENEIMKLEPSLKFAHESDNDDTNDQDDGHHGIERDEESEDEAMVSMNGHKEDEVRSLSSNDGTRSDAIKTASSSPILHHSVFSPNLNSGESRRRPSQPPPPTQRRGPFGWLRSSSQHSVTSSSLMNSPPPELTGHWNPRFSTTSSNHDLLFQRLERQNSTFSTDPKIRDAYLEANKELRNHFESIHRIRASVDLTERKQVEDEIDWEFWGQVVTDYASVAAKDPTRLSQALQSGIPDPLRGTLWQLLSGSKNVDLEEVYSDLSHQNSTHDKAIKRDLPRTFPKVEYFKSGPGQEGLFNVMKAYSLYDPEVGYTQGMAFFVGPLLMNMPEEEAFCALVRMMKGYELREMFVPDMPALHLRLYQFDRLVEDNLPILHVHLNRQGIKSSMYASQWFLTLFAYKFPLQLVFRIMDVVIVEGLEAILRFGIALLRKNYETVATLDFERLLDFLKNGLFDAYKERPGASGSISLKKEEANYSVNELVADAYAVALAPQQLSRYVTEYEQIKRAEREKEIEIDGLRSSNSSLYSKVKTLETTMAMLNKEHIALANQSVEAKMEVVKLQDEIEALKESNKRLKDLVDTQPAEVEAKLKEEMDRLLKRNEEVMTQNQDLEEQLGNMEQDLVSTKLSFAELTQSHDTLRGRWSDMKRAFDQD